MISKGLIAKEFYRLKPIRTQAEYDTTISQLDRLLTLRGKRSLALSRLIDVLTILIHQYELEHFSIPAPTAVQAIQFYMQRHSLKQKDMVPYFGSVSRVSEFLSCKRQLTVEQIAKLHAAQKKYHYSH